MARGIPDSIHKDAVQCPAQINFNTDLGMFDYFNKNGWVPQLHRTLGGGAVAMAPGIVKDYPWSEVADGTIMDIGGGGGGLIASLLREYPTLHGGIYDRADVIDHVHKFFQPDGLYADVGSRVADEHLIAGDFFKTIPTFPVYTMKWCLHDWKDEEALKILRNIRQAIKEGPKSRLVVLESVLGDGHSDRLSRYGDLNMMLTIGGRERRAEEWVSLAEQSGWEIVNIYNLRNAWMKALDFRPKNKTAADDDMIKEMGRLRMQHDWIKASMGKLVHAPVNPLKKDLKILDCATADGEQYIVMNQLTTG
jgi:gliotoxin/aspirochlorine biosynthesis O-methyltransferase